MGRRPARGIPNIDVGPTASLLVLGHRAARLLDRRLLAVNLGAGEAVVLLALREGPLTMSGVMAALSIKASTATSMVNRLESLGLVQRSPNPDDRRSLLVELTDEGISRAVAARRVFDEMDSTMLKIAGDQTIGRVRSALDVIGDRLSDK